MKDNIQARLDFKGFTEGDFFWGEWTWGGGGGFACSFVCGSLKFPFSHHWFLGCGCGFDSAELALV